MLGRAASRIDLKLEEDLVEYEEFKHSMQSNRDKRILDHPQFSLQSALDNQNNSDMKQVHMQQQYLYKNLMYQQWSEWLGDDWKYIIKY